MACLIEQQFTLHWPGQSISTLLQPTQFYRVFQLCRSEFELELELVCILKDKLSLNHCLQKNFRYTVDRVNIIALTM